MESKLGTSLLTITEASLWLRTTYTRAYNLALKGELDVVHVDGRMRVTRESVERRCARATEVRA